MQTIQIETNSPLQAYLERFTDADLIIRANNILGTHSLRLSIYEAAQVVAEWFINR